ncbi:hypothetical protein BKI52_11920 [marine bacterium AO1-C]|nr:hypothetical protein BKI52_11920 [marine bacterium AO1-C]
MYYTLRNILLLLLTVGLSYSGFAQDIHFFEKQSRAKEGKRLEKLEYNKKMFANPTTGLTVPRDQEVAFSLYLDQIAKRSRSASQNLIPVENWKQRGPFNVGGRTRALAIDRNDENTIFAGGVSGGMWRSTDGGATWNKVTGVSEIQSVMDIYQDPTNTNVWYYVTGEIVGNSASAFGASFTGNGVYKSTDNGLTWIVLPSTTTADVTTFNNEFQYNFRVRVHPTNGDVYVAGFGGIKRSTDGGATWTTVLPGAGAAYTDIELSATGVFYATIQSGATPNAGIFRSTDGTTWTNITPAGLAPNFVRVVLDIAQTDENIVYFFAATAGAGVSDHSLFRYDYTAGEGNGDGTLGNGGAWTDLTANLPVFGGSVGNLGQANYNQYIKIKPDDANVIFLGSLNIYRSTNGFADASTNAWIGGYSPLNNVSLYTNHHPDNHAMVFYPSNPNRVITGHDGGLSLTEDILANDTTGVEPVAWSSLNNGYNTTQPYAIAIDEVTANDNRIIAGFQDNATWITTSKNSDAIWQSIESGDGSYNAIEPGTGIRYVSSQRGRTLRQEEGDSTNAFIFVTPLDAQFFLFINPYVLDRTNYKRMYFLADGGVYRNPDLENKTSFGNFADGRPIFAYTNWERLDSTFLGVNFFTSALDVATDGTLYYGKAGGGEIYKVPGAATGQPGTVDIFTGKGLPNGAVSSITADPVDSSTVYATFSNYGIPSIFYTTNGGDSWTDISGNLEQNPDGSGNGPSVRWMTVHRPDAGAPIYFVGTSIGLFSTTRLDGANTVWTREGGDVIGNVVTVMVRSRASDGLVAVATHGNGVFSANLVNVPCENAQNLDVTNITLNSATLNWDAVYTAQSYDVRYKLTADSVWTTQNGVTGTSLDLSGLTSGCQYEFQVRANCLYGASEFGDSKTFQPYCEPYVHGGYFVSKVRFAGINRVSYPTYGGDAYNDLTESQTASVAQGGKYKLKLKSSFRKRYQVWIDFNHDGDFDDAGEMVYRSRGFFFGEYRARTKVRIPEDAKVGKTRMRVSMRAFFNSKDACDPIYFGKVEDFTVDIQAAGSAASRFTTFDDAPTFKAYPNPAHGRTTVSGTTDSDKLTLVLTDINGVGLRKEVLNTETGNFNKTVNLDGLKPGMYLLYIVNEDGDRTVRRIMVK